jgi:hypothetical protein
LALGFLSNSEVIRFYEEAGANLDLFYQLLWRHVLVVELVKFKYKINNEQAQNTFLNSLAQMFQKDRAKERAIAYLRTWGESFWNETEDRVKEITTKIEDELKAELEASAFGSKVSMNSGEKLTDEQKQEVVNRGSRVVTKIQIRELAEVTRLLSEEIFNDDQEAHYILIDDLDTQWVSDPLKNRLIRALIETVRTFRQQLKTVKVIVALRQDLLQRVIASTRDAGYQSEKYESLYLRIRWSASEIEEMLNLRVAHLVKQRYTSASVSMTELFPEKIAKEKFSNFLVTRTFLRPRDAIIFVNACLERSNDQGRITAQMVLDAEGSYSERRIESLQDEWGSTYPMVGAYLKIFTRGPTRMRVSELSEEKVKTWAFETLLDGTSSVDPVVKLAQVAFVEDKLSSFKFVLGLLNALYVVGAIGIKPDQTSPVYWSYFSDHLPSEGSIKPASTIELHPVFWRAVGARLV